MRRVETASARLTASLRNIPRHAARRRGQKRVPPLQRGATRRRRTHHARTISWRAHGARVGAV
eukprot:1738817-Lingulodinium_polyedra.AAC.1